MSDLNSLFVEQTPRVPMLIRTPTPEKIVELEERRRNGLIPGDGPLFRVIPHNGFPMAVEKTFGQSVGNYRRGLTLNPSHTKSMTVGGF